MNDINFSNSFYFVSYAFANNYCIDRQKGAFRHYINYVVRGRCTLTAGDTVLKLKPGDLYYIPMGLRYQARWTGENISVHSLGFTFFPEAESVSFALQMLPRSFVGEVLDIPLHIRPDSQTLSRFFSLLSRLASHLLPEETATEAPLVRKMRAYLYKYPRTRISELARQCGISPSSLYAMCRKLVNKTPNEIRQEIIIDKAILLLKSSDMTVQAISDEYGFSSPTYFRQVLKKHTGKTPRQIRSEK